MNDNCNNNITMEFISIIVLSILISTLIHYLFFSDSQKGLPPGPKSWPFVGNLFQIGGNNPHKKLAQMAQTYGELMKVKMGTQTLIVASTPSSAMEILKTHDRVASGRYILQSFRTPENIEKSMVWSDCSEIWKMLRKVCRTELFTRKMIEAHAHMRESKAMEMVEYLKRKQGCEVNIAEVVFETLGNIFGNLFLSQDVFELGIPSGGNAEMKKQFESLLELGLSPNPADFYPILGRFDLFGQRKEVAKGLGKISHLWEVKLKERKAMKSTQGIGENQNNDFMDILINSGIEDSYISVLLTDLFGGGAKTSTTTVEWAISEFTKKPHIPVKIREELSLVVGNNLVKESDIPNLPYLQACIKETLRLHPTAPLLLPHRATETCQVMNHTIPKDCQIMVNAWAIGRDPNTWKDAFSFSPKRFLDSSVDFKGHHFELLPFGGGRRTCPGLPLATQMVSLMVATIVQNFEWDLPNGMDPRDLSMDEEFGLTLHKEAPLCIVPKPRF